jgi:hypothetical protein
MNQMQRLARDQDLRPRENLSKSRSSGVTNRKSRADMNSPRNRGSFRFRVTEVGRLRIAQQISNNKLTLKVNLGNPRAQQNLLLSVLRPLQ